MKKIVFVTIGSVVAGVAATIVDILTYRSAMKSMEEIGGKVNNALNRIETLEMELKTVKKEKIDDWMDSAAEVLANQQDELDRLRQLAAKMNIMCTSNSSQVNVLEDDVRDIKEILEKTSCVKFNQSQDNDD